MTDAELVARKLTVLREHLERMKRRRPNDLEELRSDVERQDALALSVLVVVQEATDIAFHVCADDGWGLPATYREGFEMLARHGVIDAALASSLAGATHLRNRIAHGYATVDVERLWRDVPTGVAAFEAFAAAIARHLQAG
jgi:uncharacterized protein YutE (UPF0331/DUF86 family)